MLNQLTPDRRQRATDYVAQLLELQRAQDSTPQQAIAGRGRVAGGGPWAARGQRDLAVAAPLKSTGGLHVSGHMPGYNAAEPNTKLAHQDPLSPLRLHTLQPRPQEALDHMVGLLRPLTSRAIFCRRQPHAASPPLPTETGTLDVSELCLLG